MLAAQQQAAEAGSAQTRAEADRAAAERRAAEDRAALERVRAELQQLRTDHHDELAAPAAKPPKNAPRCAAKPASSCAAVLARFDTTSGADIASTPTPARRGHPKPTAD